MKLCNTIVAALLISANLFAQDSKLEIISKPIYIPEFEQPQHNLSSSALLQGRLICSVVGIPVQKSEIHLPFKLYTFENTNWIIHQDMYNSIRANVPNVQITHTNLDEAPSILMRGDDNVIVLVDGIRYDASILNTLNPADIESVKVSNNPAAEVYFRLR